MNFTKLTLVSEVCMLSGGTSDQDIKRVVKYARSWYMSASIIYQFRTKCVNLDYRVLQNKFLKILDIRQTR